MPPFAPQTGAAEHRQTQSANMKYPPFYFVVLVAALFVSQINGKETRGHKPVVYNYQGKHPDPELEAVVKKAYATKYEIVDIAPNKSFVDVKCSECPFPERRRDASGRVLTGTVFVVFIVNSEGRVQDPIILRSSNLLLNAHVLSGVKLWRHTPARLNGLAVAGASGAELVFEKPQSQKRIPGFSDSMAIDAKGVKHTPSDDPDGLAPWMEDITKRVQPEGPHNSDRQFEGEGLGVYRVTIDLKTGIVTDVTIVRSTEYPRLDANARVALRQWRWKPEKWRQVDIPVVFGRPSRSWTPSMNDPFPRAQPSFPTGITP